MSGGDGGRAAGVGMVMEAGEWRAPVPETVLRVMREVAEGDHPATLAGREAAIAVLRQTFEARSPEELAVFARDLAAIIRDGPPWQAFSAYTALIGAAATTYNMERGPAYAGAVDAFIWLYESYADPIARDAEGALRGVFHTGGIQYVRDLYDASERPPDCQYPSQTMIEGPDGTMVWETEEDLANPCPNRSTWCTSGGILTMNTDEGPDLEDWEWLCSRKRF